MNETEMSALLSESQAQLAEIRSIRETVNQQEEHFRTVGEQCDEHLNQTMTTREDAEKVLKLAETALPAAAMSTLTSSFFEAKLR